jgi:hypothetical protein
MFVKPMAFLNQLSLEEQVMNYQELWFRQQGFAQYGQSLF